MFVELGSQKEFGRLNDDWYNKRTMNDIKTCRKCNFTGELHFFIKRENVCKKCQNIASRKFYDANREKILIKKKEKHDREKTLGIIKYNEEYELNRVRKCRECSFEGKGNLFIKKANLCRECNKRIGKENYEKNKEDRVLKSKEYYQENRDKKIAYNKKHYQENREEINEKNREYYKENSEAVIAINKQYYEKNKDIINEKKAAYAKNNPDEVKEKRRLYALNNKEKIYLKNRNWYLNNKDKKAINDKKYRQSPKGKEVKKRSTEKQLSTPNGKINSRIANMIRKDLLRNSSFKEDSKNKYLEYTIEELKNHLEKQFEPWMSWENHGAYHKDKWDDNDQTTWKWNIDHIIPRSHLTYTSMQDENFKKCWALENIRPLSAKQNVCEGNRRGKK